MTIKSEATIRLREQIISVLSGQTHPITKTAVRINLTHCKTTQLNNLMSEMCAEGEIVCYIGSPPTYALASVVAFAEFGRELWRNTCPNGCVQEMRGHYYRGAR